MRKNPNSYYLGNPAYPKENLMSKDPKKQIVDEFYFPTLSPDLMNTAMEVEMQAENNFRKF